jgi:hypothetical protein
LTRIQQLYADRTATDGNGHPGEREARLRFALNAGRLGYRAFAPGTRRLLACDVHKEISERSPAEEFTQDMRLGSLHPDGLQGREDAVAEAHNPAHRYRLGSGVVPRHRRKGAGPLSWRRGAALYIDRRRQRPGRANIAVPMVMALDELATDAAKYGALSNARGRVTVAWSVLKRGDSPRLQVQWEEAGGPPLGEPKLTGLGSRLIRRLSADASGTVAMRFAGTGLVCTFDLPFSAGGNP